jgi:Phosphate-selective porin O and P
MAAREPGFSFRVLFICLAAGILLCPGIGLSQATIKVNDDINFKVGTLIQAWADSAQDPATGGYARNLFLRRIRLIVGGQLAKNITFFFETDNPNLGKAPKNLSGGFITQDAFVEWKPVSNAFLLDAGLMFVPLCRNCLESAGTLMSLDYGSFAFTQSAATQSSTGRDTGFQAKGYLADGHLEYRAGVFQGVRQAGSRNGFRTAARLQYAVWQTETGYLYPGLYLGDKKVLSFGAGLDHQQDYDGYSADVFLSAPLADQNALNGELTLLHFDGGSTFTTIPEQSDATLQVGYYLAPSKVMPWLRLEEQDFRSSVDNPRDNKRLQAGVTWLPRGNNFNIKAAYSRVDPRAGRNLSQYTVQLQFFYY